MYQGWKERGTTPAPTYQPEDYHFPKHSGAIAGHVNRASKFLYVNEKLGC